MARLVNAQLWGLVLAGSLVWQDRLHHADAVGWVGGAGVRWVVPPICVLGCMKHPTTAWDTLVLWREISKRSSYLNKDGCIRMRQPAFTSNLWGISDWTWPVFQPTLNFHQFASLSLRDRLKFSEARYSLLQLVSKPVSSCFSLFQPWPTQIWRSMDETSRKTNQFFIPDYVHGGLWITKASPPVQ
jgi:hypothetical protein